MNKTLKKSFDNSIRVICILVTFVLISNNQVYSQSITINNNNLYSEKSITDKFIQFYNSHDYQNAVLYYEKLQDKHKNLKYFELYSNALFSSGEYSKARKSFEYIRDNSKDTTLINNAKKMIKIIDKALPDLKDSSKTSANSNPCKNHSSVKWNKSSVKVYLPQLPRQIELKIISQKIGDSDTYVNIIKKSFRKWSDKVSGLNFHFISNKSDADIIVNWHFHYNNLSSWDLVSYPTYYGNSNNRIGFVNIPIMINPRYTPGGEDEAFYSMTDIEAMSLHQIGHALDLKDNSDNDSVMNPDSKYMNFNILGDAPEEIQLSLSDIEAAKNSILSLNSDCDDTILAKKYSSKDMRDDSSDNYLCFLSGGQPKLHSDGMSYLRQYSRWDKKDFPLKVYIPLPPGLKYNLDNPGHFSDMARTAFLRWSVAVPEIAKFNFINDEKDADIIVRWTDNFEHKDYWGLASSISYPDNPNRKRKCYIDLAVRAQPGWYSEKPIFFGDETFVNIATHEMGHALGLDHGPDVNGATGRGDLITDRDINTLRKMYSVPNGYQFLCGL